jgi:non-homologous end joining protein Ku
MARGIWSGVLSFGLVSVPVVLFGDRGAQACVPRVREGHR